MIEYRERSGNENLRRKTVEGTELEQGQKGELLREKRKKKGSGKTTGKEFEYHNKFALLTMF